MNCIIVDDEPVSHQIISDYCKKCGELNIVGCFQNPLEAINYLDKNFVEIIFLDINMPELSGVEFSNSLVKPFKIIVTTAYEEFALESFNFGAIDYLLKPFSFSRFIKAVSKAKNYNLEGVNTNSRGNETIIIRSDRKNIQLKTASIVFIKSYGNYCKIVTENETLLMRETLTNFLSILPKMQFIQIHKSYVVNKYFIRSRNNRSVEILNHNLPIGTSFKDSAFKLLNF
jgi:DNA-binding LytR/AlgR family response regulator